MPYCTRLSAARAAWRTKSLGRGFVEGVGISISGDDAMAFGTSRRDTPQVADTLTVAFVDPAFPTLEATVLPAVGENEIVIELGVDQTRQRLTRAAVDEFGSARKAAGSATDWIVRGAASSTVKQTRVLGHFTEP